MDVGRKRIELRRIVASVMDVLGGFEALIRAASVPVLEIAKTINHRGSKCLEDYEHFHKKRK